MLAQFYYVEEELTDVLNELDSFDGRKEPERCQQLVTRLRACQDKALSLITKMIQEALPVTEQAARDFRAKFPDDVLHENLAGQLWFGAEVSYTVFTLKMCISSCDFFHLKFRSAWLLAQIFSTVKVNLPACVHSPKL